MKMLLSILRTTTLFVFASACAADARSQTPRPCDANQLRSRFVEIARKIDGRVGAAAAVIEENEKNAAVSVNGATRFPMQSVYKLPIGMAVLRRVDAGELSLEGKVVVRREDLAPERLHSPLRDKNPDGAELTLRELLRLMISESDGTASDVLLGLAGGPERVTEYLRGLGVEGVVVATSERAMAQGGEQVQYRNWATPDSMLSLLRALQEGRGLSVSGRSLLLDFMTGSTPGPRRIKGKLPAGTVVAHKTGTSNTVEGLTRATNDVGLVTLPDGRHMAVVVFVSDTKADADAREGTIASVARAAWDCRAVALKR
jgi:beta-lactamase class A